MSERRSERQTIIDYHQKFGDEQGKRILEDLERRCVLVRHGIRHEHGVDVNRLLIMEGEADIFKYIKSMLEKDPDKKRQKKATNKQENVNE